MALTWLWGAPGPAGGQGAESTEGAEGADGNARLTGAVGLVLLVVLFIEGITVLEVRQMITLHIFVGLVLVPPTALKLGSTIYRFVRYYTGSPGYLRHGPPPPLLRWTAPLLIVFTAALLVSGVALLAMSPERPGLFLTAHKASFVIWFALMALHVLGHLKGAFLLSRRDWWPRADRDRPREKGPSGKGQRRGLVAISLVAGVALAVALLPVASPWTTRPIRHDGVAQSGRAGVLAQSTPSSVLAQSARSAVLAQANPSVVTAIVTASANRPSTVAVTAIVTASVNRPSTVARELL